MRKLIKVDNLNNEKNNLESHYYIHPGMSCGSYYHANNKHKFIGENKEEVDRLIYIIEKLNIANVEKLNDTSFIFEGINRKAQKFIFKLCRYTRMDFTNNILSITEKGIKNGLQPHNALLIGHYDDKISKTYYRDDMDIVPISSYSIPKKGYATFNEFKDRFNKSGQINSVYKSNRSIDINKLKTLIKQDNLIEAEKLIIK